jgi:hypothetical protein
LGTARGHEKAKKHHDQEYHSHCGTGHAAALLMIEVIHFFGWNGRRTPHASVY